MSDFEKGETYRIVGSESGKIFSMPYVPKMIDQEMAHHLNGYFKLAMEDTNEPLKVEYMNPESTKPEDKWKP